MMLLGHYVRISWWSNKRTLAQLSRIELCNCHRQHSRHPNPVDFFHLQSLSGDVAVVFIHVILGLPHVLCLTLFPPYFPFYLCLVPRPNVDSCFSGDTPSMHFSSAQVWRNQCRQRQGISHSVRTDESYIISQLYRAIQYFSRVLAWYLLFKGKTDQAARWSALKNHLALARKRAQRPRLNSQFGANDSHQSCASESLWNTYKLPYVLHRHQALLGNNSPPSADK